MREAAREWLLSAEMDLAVCARLCDDADLTPMFAFHAQQCIEKLLKGFLEEYQQPVPRSHDLVRLNQLVKEGVKKSVELDQDLLEELSTIYMDARYPSDLGLLPNGKPSLSDARRYHEAALRLRNQLASVR